MGRKIVKQPTLAGELTDVVVKGVVKGVWTAINILVIKSLLKRK